MRKKYIIITGWVISGIGKWVTTASAGFFFSEKYKVCPIKLDGYLNIDPGTMNPREHGEVFVLDDGAEVDMDFGHYERFLNVQCSWMQSISMWKIYAGVLEKERRWNFLWKTVQMIPHVTDHICERIEEVFSLSRWEICIIEVGWTVWDIEVELYLEALRQMKRKKKTEDFLHIHLSYVPIPWGVLEQKTKPTQQSINLLQSRWLFPDIIAVRSKEKLTKESRDKIALFSHLRDERIISIPDVNTIYSLPSILTAQNFPQLVHGKLCIPYAENSRLEQWNNILKTNNQSEKQLRIGIIWKYTTLEDSYSSVVEALNHAAFALGVSVEISFINTRKKNGIEWVKKCDGCIIPGGFWDTAVENMISTLKYIREHKIPCLGICLWMQLMTLEFARNVLGIEKANSLEFEKDCFPYDIITLLDSQKNIVNLWGTMRLWAQKSLLRSGIIKDLYKNSERMNSRWVVRERFRHRFEVHPTFADGLAGSDLKVTWVSQNKHIVQFVELRKKVHPFYVWTQSHAELTSKLEDPAPLFVWLLEVCRK